jgi:hypothetical protein
VERKYVMICIVKKLGVAFAVCFLAMAAIAADLSSPPFFQLRLVKDTPSDDSEQMALITKRGDRNKALENPGADALLQKLGGPAGLPYSAFLDAQGSLIVNSKREGQNIGYPGEPQEIDWFMLMMKKAAPKMSETDLKTIEAALRSFKRT